MSYVSLGTTCINKYHILKRFNDTRGCPFDFRITTPDALIYILQSILDKKLDENIISQNNYNVVSRTSYKNFIEHRLLVNFKLIHDFDIYTIESKIRHQFDNFINLKEPTFIWSNSQGDIETWEDGLGIPIEEFYLTEHRYSQICSLIDQIFGSKSIVKFAVRPEYTDKLLLNKSNVYIVDIPKTTIWSKASYGTKDQFESIFV
jgi:hypothetical protein